MPSASRWLIAKLIGAAVRTHEAEHPIAAGRIGERSHRLAPHGVGIVVVDDGRAIHREAQVGAEALARRSANHRPERPARSAAKATWAAMEKTNAQAVSSRFMGSRKDRLRIEAPARCRHDSWCNRYVAGDPFRSHDIGVTVFPINALARERQRFVRSVRAECRARRRCVQAARAHRPTPRRRLSPTPAAVATAHSRNRRRPTPQPGRSARRLRRGDAVQSETVHTPPPRSL